ncbi:MAG: type IV secretion protein [Gracilibacter sp. BRH_c7a]|nr:MAG: type IV secretion protein [Gracilibacter sp. BRH_c7a]
MELIIIFSGASLVFFLLIALFANKINLSLPQNRVLRSLGQIGPIKESEPIPKYSLKERVQILFHKSFHLFSNSKKENKYNEKDQALAAAGLTSWSSTEWKILTYASALFGVLLSSIASLFITAPLFAKLEISLIGIIIAYLLPNYWLKIKIRKRKEEIVNSLPDVLDLVMVSVEAGLGFDSAILKVVEKQHGVLADELNILLKEINMGKPRRNALRDMAKKNNVEDLSNVVASLVQADQLGISMGSVLRNQSKQLRQKRKQRAKEQAQKTPVKIMIPLVFFIFPSVFIVILGPAVLRIIEVFGK